MDYLWFATHVSNVFSKTGISTAVPFQEGVHPAAHKHKGYDGSCKCEDIFKPFVEIGQDVMPRKSNWRHSFTAPSVRATRVTVEVYKTEREPVPMLTFDCIRVAELHLNLSTMDRTEKAVIDVEMQLGDTTLTVTAQEQGTRRPVKTEFNFLH